MGLSNDDVVRIAAALNQGGITQMAMAEAAKIG